MAIEGLSIIGESINASVPSTEKLFEAGDFDGIQALARMQEELGAAYIDVNVGRRPPEFMAETVRHVQEATSRPLSIDTPDPANAEAGLRAYNPEKAGGALPVLNSVSPLRLEMFELYRLQAFMPVLMITERAEGGQSRPNHTAEEIHETARDMIEAVRKSGQNVPNTQCIFDPGMPSIGSDMDGATETVLEALGRIHADADLAGTHVSVGLSNFTNMLPRRKGDGSPVRSPLESAFLTLAMPVGLDMVIGSVKRKYCMLANDDPALACLNAVFALKGPDRLMKLMEFYT